MKTVLITGAAGSLGKAIVAAYVKAGFFVIATDVHDGLLNSLPANKNIMAFTLDVTSGASFKKCVEKVTQRVSRIDILISNAAIFDFYPLAEAGSEKLGKLFAVNVFGLANLTKYFLPYLAPGTSRLLVVSSESYKVPSPFQPYAVSKQALETLYKAIKTELELMGIKCILIRPGAIQTNILDQTMRFSKYSNDSLFDIMFRNFVKTVPKYIWKITKPEEAASVILKAGSIKNPKSVYSFNHSLPVSLLSLLPARLQYIIIRNKLK